MKNMIVKEDVKMQDLSNENIIHIKNEKMEYLQFRRLLQYKEVTHAITLKPFNFCSNVEYEANKDKVENNYKDLCNCLQIDKNKIIRAKQTHTDIIKCVTQDEIGIFPNKLDDVDGLITNERGLVLSLVFADCIPLIFYDPIKKVIANVHSGWKGTVQKIADKAIEKMINSYNCYAKDILCFIGPSIGKCHFEVEEDVFVIFKEAFKKMECFNEMVEKKKTKNGEVKYYIDTIAINRILLEKNGLLPENIIESNICTVCNSNYTHSFRADQNNSGRATCIISLN